MKPLPVLLGLALLVAACGSDAPSGEEALFDLEQLAFVPALTVRIPPPPYIGEDCRIAEALLVDRYEVPRGRFLEFVRGAGAEADSELATRAREWTEETWSWPATWMTHEEARAYARSRGMRLLTAREWLAVASGTRALQYPWGPSRASLVANTLELSLSRPLPVGTFEQGATPYSTYEMLGNVWEWVDDPIDVGRARELDSSTLAWVMGGSFSNWLEPLYSIDEIGRPRYQAKTLDPLSRGDDIGLRCAVSARTYFLAHADAFSNDEETRARLVAIGRRFGRDAVPLLDELVRTQGGAQSLRWLLEGAAK